MKKVIILGCPGSGKSFLARRLQTVTGLPLTHLDNVWWNSDRSHITRDEFDRRLAEILRADEWILDGDYSRTYEVRFAVCDTVLFLDYPQEQCLAGITQRVGTVRPDIPWTEQSLDPELTAQVLCYRTENRPQVLALAAKYPQKELHIFRSREEADSWLLSLPTPGQPQSEV